MNEVCRTLKDSNQNDTVEWWRGAAIYQIYPRSFADSNGDGIGDLPGITAHLDHVARLGVDAIWISPFFTSPMADYGYDVADYRDVDPTFGTLADFDALVARAHDLGLKVTIDLVFAHTSDHHAWFAQSRSDRENPLADWYVWADPRPDGTPPNNWQSVFGGPAWTWDGRRRQYYYHQFLKEQPQLNVHNPAVQNALLDVVRFWLERGVDGFRFDALNHSMFDPALTDNPPADNDGPRTRPYDYQAKVYSMNHPDVIGFVERIRGICDEHGAIFTVAEVGGDDPMRWMKAYTAGNHRLSSAYGFDFLYAPELTAELVARVMRGWPDHPVHGHTGHDHLAEGWPSWAFENHDAPRCLSRWAGDDNRPAFARMLLLLLASLRGNIFLYQGQELGLLQDEIPFHLLKDPEAIANWPLTLSRDGVRTPMPWLAGAPNGGFTKGTPWLPLSAGNIARAVDAQEADPTALLHFTRQVLALRRGHRALHHGAIDHIRAQGDLLSFTRRVDGEAIHCAFNIGGQRHTHKCPVGDVLLAVNEADNGHLPPWGAIIIRETSA
ncbi:alpha-amylase family protein [Novosphingobium nitrogenifigens DSM 19370]|uniref:Alpha-amylase family protein n=1 Tax=Novosphingobium nitrogenifigens DSM 19370 TaxID=983920 RepID=F1ZAZ8_9SPHN|nr:alpha-amylase family glycosyl hydrolase [Novosphingobium nitrogenifigens]EGD58224.1 alpha-amylase family protein [Novosphingobium nitrogenifigens DSM 19370]